MIRTDDNYIHSELTDKIINSAYDVYNQLGYGFMEKVYENAMMIKLPQKGLELKAVSSLSKAHEVQLVNYLKATGVKVGLLINFGEKLKIIRRVF